MTENDLQADNHIVRYVKPVMILKGVVNGVAFRLRNLNEIGLSVNWLEKLGQEKPDQLAKLRRVHRLKLSRNGRFAEICVGTVKEKLAEKLDTLRILHDPLEPEDGHDADPSHAQITGLPPFGSAQVALVGDLIAQCVEDMHPTQLEANE